MELCLRGLNIIDLAAYQSRYRVLSVICICMQHLLRTRGWPKVLQHNSAASVANLVAMSLTTFDNSLLMVLHATAAGDTRSFPLKSAFLIFFFFFKNKLCLSTS